MHREATQCEERLGRDALGHAHDLVVRHADLRGLLPGLGVRMRLSRDTRVHADAQICTLFQLVRDGDHGVELRGRLNVEEPYAYPDRLFELERGLADA